MSRFQKLTLFFLSLVVFFIPFEHKYDKLFRFFSLTLVPEGLVLPKGFDKKIYFYLSDLAMLLLSFALLFVQKIPFRQFFTQKKASFLWIFFGFALFSIVLSPLSHYAIPYVRLLQLLTPILLYSVFVNTFTKEEEISKAVRSLFKVLVAAAVLQAGIAIAQWFHQGPIGLHLFGEEKILIGGFESETGNLWTFDLFRQKELVTKHLSRASGTLPHPNVLGGFLVIGLLALYPLILKAKSKRAQLLLGGAIPLLIFALFLSFSRAALFAFGLGTTLFASILLYQRGFFSLVKDKSFRFLFLAVSASLLFSFSLLYEQILFRGGVLNHNTLSKQSNQARRSYQNIAFEYLQKRPLSGVGFQLYSYAAKDELFSVPPHNIYLLIAVETGIFSLGIFLAFLALLLKRSLKALQTLEGASLFSTSIALLLIGCFDFYPILFQQGKLPFFTAIALLGALSFRKEESSSPSRSEVWKMFNQISSTYDRINRILSLGMDRHWRKELSRKLPLKKDLSVLDLATGTGDQLFALFETPKRHAIASAVGVDLAEKMLEIAEQKGALKPYREKVLWKKGDAEKIPFSNESFDAVTFSFGIRNVIDPLTSMKEIYRVLKPSGKCLILEFSLPPFPIRPFYLFYLRYLLPRIGGALSQSTAAYRYLNETIETFPSGKAFGSLLKAASFEKVQAYPMAFGAVTLYSGEKR